MPMRWSARSRSACRSSTGSLSGTPTAAGSFANLQVRATDADGRTGLSDAFAITVSQPLSIAGTPATAATTGTAYAAAYAGRNGRQPYVYALAAGTLPNGLSSTPPPARSRARPRRP